MPTTDPVKAALAVYGTQAIPGAESNPAVVEYFREAKHPEVTQDDIPWCAAFMNAIMQRCGLPQTGSLLARSFLDIGVPVTVPQMGDIVVLQRGGENSGLGHVGLFICTQGDKTYLLGGNEDNRVEIAPFFNVYIIGVRRVEIK